MTQKEFFEELDKHDRIGWDLDGTLIDALHGPLLLEWIKANRAGKRHHIVTFRNGQLLHTLEEELDRAHKGSLGYFSRIHTMPENVKWDKSSREVCEYKPRVCKEHGYTVLIDDLQFLKEECEVFGIKYLDPFHAQFLTPC